MVESEKVTVSHVLLIDDDCELSAMLADYFAQEGFTTRRAFDGESGLREALAGDYALLVLDVMLPGLNGIEVLRNIRARSQVPILMLTARGDEVDLIMGLELGADDYVAKPCSPRKLVARMRALLRRAAVAQSGGFGETLRVGPLTLWPGKRVAEWAGARLDFTATEFNLLEVLARRAGNIVSKNELSDRALGRPLGRFDRCIDVHVSSIRQKLPERPDRLPWIQTVRGRGYLLVPE